MELLGRCRRDGADNDRQDGGSRQHQALFRLAAPVDYSSSHYAWGYLLVSDVGTLEHSREEPSQSSFTYFGIASMKVAEAERES